jgi:aminoglycoside phosphotransferase (APT) family kinase protein
MEAMTPAETGRPVVPAGIEPVLAATGVRPDEVTECNELAGGTFNAVYLARLIDGSGLVVKVAPDPAGPMLQYERGILATEAMYYRLAGRCTGVTVPSVVAVDAGSALVPGGYLVMTQCQGATWRVAMSGGPSHEQDRLRAELGRQVASLHTITGSGFGYPSQALGPLRSTWRIAFLEMVDAVLADAERFSVALPRPVAEVRDLFAAQAAVLEQVTTPVLVHFDLWEGNVMVGQGGTGRQLTGLIDAERAFWGDPLAEFVSLALFGDPAQDAALLDGYRAAGGTVSFDDAGRLRLALYRTYLYLIMWVEAIPRGFDAGARSRLVSLVLRPMEQAFAEWSASG